MTCAICKADPHPSLFSEPRRCAFPYEEYTIGNWQCGTMNELRARCTWEMRDDDAAGTIGVLFVPGEHYIVMNWYKQRGACGRAIVMSDDEAPWTLTLGEAEQALEKVRTRQ